MHAFLPHGTDQSRVAELRASARKRHEMEALAIEKYERDVLAYRVFMQPQHDLEHIASAAADALEPRRSLA